MKLKIIKLSDNTIIPHRKYDHDAGLDVHLPDNLYLSPHKAVQVPLGFKLEIPKGYKAYLSARSSSVKRGIMVVPIPMDSNYTAEVNLLVYNVSSDKIFLNAGERIAQLEYEAIVYVELVEEDVPVRGDNGLGSSGK